MAIPQGLRTDIFILVCALLIRDKAAGLPDSYLDSETEQVIKHGAIVVSVQKLREHAPVLFCRNTGTK